MSQCMKIVSLSFKCHRRWMLLLLLLVCNLVATQARADECVRADDFGSITRKNVMVRADGNYSATSGPSGVTYYNTGTGNYGKWMSTGVRTEKGQNLTLSTKGRVYLCNPVKDVPFDVNARNKDWQSTGIQLSGSSSDGKIGDFYRIVVGEPNNQTKKDDIAIKDNKVSIKNNPDKDSLCNTGMTNKTGCWYTYGGLLRVRVNDGSNSGLNRYAYYGYQGTAEKSGILEMKIQDGEDDYGDNEGGYRVRIYKYSCLAENGTASNDLPQYGQMQAIITNSDPNETMEKSTVISLTSGAFSGPAPAGGKVWLRVAGTTSQSSAGWYGDRMGEYDVYVETVTYNHVVSDLVGYVVEPTKRDFYEAADTIYRQITDNYQYIRIVHVVLVLYMVLYAVFFVAGVVELSQQDLVMRLFKISIIIALSSNTSFRFFNEYVFTLFREGSDWLVQIVSGNQGDDHNTFAFLDRSIGYFFESATWKKLAALPFTGLYGVVYLGCILFGMWAYTVAIAEAIISYLMAIIAISVMIILAPIFFIFMMFGHTKPMFDNWLSATMSFAMQPVIVFTALAVLNELMVIAFQGVLAYDVCWQTILPIFVNLGDGTKITFANLSWWNPQDFAQFSFATIVVYMILSRLTQEFLDSAPQMAAYLVGVNLSDIMGLSGGGSPSRAAFDKIKDTAKSLVGQDAKTQGRIKEQDAAKQAKAKEDKGGEG